IAGLYGDVGIALLENLQELIHRHLLSQATPGGEIDRYLRSARRVGGSRPFDGVEGGGDGGDRCPQGQGPLHEGNTAHPDAGRLDRQFLKLPVLYLGHKIRTPFPTNNDAMRQSIQQDMGRYGAAALAFLVSWGGL